MTRSVTLTALKKWSAGVDREQELSKKMMQIPKPLIYTGSLPVIQL